MSILRRLQLATMLACACCVPCSAAPQSAATDAQEVAERFLSCLAKHDWAGAWDKLLNPDALEMTAWQRKLKTLFSDVTDVTWAKKQTNRVDEDRITISYTLNVVTKAGAFPSALTLHLYEREGGWKIGPVRRASRTEPLDDAFNVTFRYPSNPDENTFQNYEFEVVTTEDLLGDQSIVEWVLYVSVPEHVVVNYTGDQDDQRVVAGVVDRLKTTHYPPRPGDYEDLLADDETTAIIRDTIHGILGLLPLVGEFLGAAETIQKLLFRPQSNTPPRNSTFFDKNNFDTITIAWERDTLIPQDVIAARCRVPCKFIETRGALTYYLWLHATRLIGRGELIAPPTKHEEHVLGPFTINPWSGLERASPALGASGETPPLAEGG